MLGHEVDLVRGRELGGDDHVAFVLAILGIHKDVRTPVTGIVDDIFDRADRAIGHGRCQLHYAVSCHRAR